MVDWGNDLGERIEGSEIDQEMGFLVNGERRGLF